jgi:hypothetical protein
MKLLGEWVSPQMTAVKSCCFSFWWLSVQQFNFAPVLASYSHFQLSLIEWNSTWWGWWCTMYNSAFAYITNKGLKAPWKPRWGLTIIFPSGKLCCVQGGTICTVQIPWVCYEIKASLIGQTVVVPFRGSSTALYKGLFQRFIHISSMLSTIHLYYKCAIDAPSKKPQKAPKSAWMGHPKPFHHWKWMTKYS